MVVIRHCWICVWYKLRHRWVCRNLKPRTCWYLKQVIGYWYLGGTVRCKRFRTTSSIVGEIIRVFRYFQQFEEVHYLGCVWKLWLRLLFRWGQRRAVWVGQAERGEAFKEVSMLRTRERAPRWRMTEGESRLAVSSTYDFAKRRIEGCGCICVWRFDRARGAKQRRRSSGWYGSALKVRWK